MNQLAQRRVAEANRALLLGAASPIGEEPRKGTEPDQWVVKCVLLCRTMDDGQQPLLEVLGTHLPLLGGAGQLGTELVVKHEELQRCSKPVVVVDGHILHVHKHVVQPSWLATQGATCTAGTGKAPGPAGACGGMETP